MCLVQSKILAGLARQEQGILAFSRDEIEAWTIPAVRLWIWKLAFKLDQGEAWSDRMIYLYAKGSLSSAFKGKVVSMLVQLNQKKVPKSLTSQGPWSWPKKIGDVIWRSNIRLHPSVVQCAVTVPASPSEPFSSIFLSTGLKNHRGSRARRGRRDYSDQTVDRRAHGPNVMYAASPASRGDPDSSGLGSACSLLSRSRVHGRLQPFVSTLSCYHLAFISWVSSSSPLSSSLCSITHSTWRTPQPPPPQKPSRAWILILFQGQVAGVQKVTMIEITFAITDHHQGRVWLQSRIGFLFRTNW